MTHVPVRGGMGGVVNLGPAAGLVSGVYPPQPGHTHTCTTPPRPPGICGAGPCSRSRAKFRLERVRAGGVPVGALLGQAAGPVRGEPPGALQPEHAPVGVPARLTAISTPGGPSRPKSTRVSE